jgi:hypothetical protein
MGAKNAAMPGRLAPVSYLTVAFLYHLIGSPIG